MAKEDNKIKDKEIQSTGFENRSKEFQEAITSKEEVYELIQELLEKSTENAFSSKGIKKVEGHAGEYGNGKKYGFGASEGKYNATFSNKVKTLIEKVVTYGSKRIINQVYINFDAKSETLRVYYDGTEGAVFKGHMNNDDPMGYMINDKIIINTSDKKKLKSELKKFFDNASKKEVNYLLTTKLGVDDKMTTSTDSSIVEENKKQNMKLTNLLDSSEEEISNYFQGKINESLEKIKTSEFSDAQKSLNTTTDTKTGKDLLFDDLEEEQDEDVVDEVSSTGGVGGGYSTKYAFKMGGDFDKDMKNEGDGSYPDKVEMNKGGWPPKGMEKNYVSGQHGLNENQLKAKAKAKEILHSEYKNDTVKKKFFSEEENKALGINKRYLITDKLNEDDQYAKWKRLSCHSLNETIYKAEDVLTEDQLSILSECACQDNLEIDKDLYIDRESAEDEMNDQFEDYNEDDLVDVEKPGSFVLLKVKQDDLMNENKKFIYDYNTKNYVINPNLNSLFENKEGAKVWDLNPNKDIL